MRQGRKEIWGGIKTFTLTDGEVAVRGEAAVIDTASGKVIVATNDTGLVPIGRFAEDLTASGDSPVKIELFREIRIHWWDNSGVNAVTAAHIGSTVYFEDATTVGSLSTDLSAAGKCFGVDANYGVAVEMA